MRTFIYNRISSEGQKDGVSLDVQLDICKRACVKNNLGQGTVIQEIHSAFKQTPPLLLSLLGKKKSRIVCYSVDRFSRNMNNGLANAQKLIKAGCVLVFIREKLIVDRASGPMWLNFVKALSQAEAESQAISDRVKGAVRYLKKNGFHLGKIAPYGSCIVADGKRRRLMPVKEEEHVIKFIQLCRTKSANVSEIKATLAKFAPSAKKDPLEFTHKDNPDVLMKRLKYAMLYGDIAYFLNEYGSTFREKKWTAQTVTKVYRASLKGDEEVEELDDLFNLSISNDSDDEKKVPKKGEKKEKERKVMEEDNDEDSDATVEVDSEEYEEDMKVDADGFQMPPLSFFSPHSHHSPHPSPPSPRRKSKSLPTSHKKPLFSKKPSKKK